MMSYVILKTLSGKAKEVSVVTYIVGALFLLKYIM